MNLLLLILCFPVPAFMAMLGLWNVVRKLDFFDDNYEEYWNEIRFYRLIGSLHLIFIIASIMGTILFIPKLLDLVQIASQLP